MAKRILNRKDLRADYDAAERRKAGEERDETEEQLDEEDEEEEEARAEDEAGDEDEGDVGEVATKKRKPPAKAKTTKTRSRSAKVARLKVVWGVFNNSNQCIATFDYPKRQEAEDLVAKLTAEKKNTHFIQPVKEPIEEKK
jgi:hypothetical protein